MDRSAEREAREQQHQPGREQAAGDQQADSRGAHRCDGVYARARHAAIALRYLAGMRRWKPTRVEAIFEHRLFRLERHQLAAGEARRESLVLRAPDWVNVVPLLPDGRVLLVRQWRFGVQAPTLEIPGGMVDEGESPQEAAARELLEETGHRAAAWRYLGEVEPNPAFISNRCTTFLATDLERLGEPLGDGEEEIALETAALGDISRLIAGGEIRHALVIAAFYHLGLQTAP